MAAAPENRKASLADVLDRVLDTGVTVRGDVIISVADVDLIYLDLRVLLASARKMDIYRAEQGRKGHSAHG